MKTISLTWSTDLVGFRAEGLEFDRLLSSYYKAFKDAGFDVGAFPEAHGLLLCYAMFVFRPTPDVRREAKISSRKRRVELTIPVELRALNLVKPEWREGLLGLMLERSIASAGGLAKKAFDTQIDQLTSSVRQFNQERFPYYSELEQFRAIQPLLASAAGEGRAEPQGAPTANSISFQVVIQLPVRSIENLDLEAIEESLNAILRSAGVVDGNDLGDQTFNLFVLTERLSECITSSKRWLEAQGFLDIGVVASSEMPVDEYQVHWPTDHKGTFEL